MGKGELRLSTASSDRFLIQASPAVASLFLSNGSQGRVDYKHKATK